MRTLASIPPLSIVVALAVFGCGDSASDPSSDDGAQGADSSPDAALQNECDAHVDCDDGLFCTGTEQCEAGKCVPGAPIACDDAIDCTVDACDDDAQACRNLPPDQDGDGHFDVACLDREGSPLGDDCDDLDEAAFPGNPEVCDAADHDEDCKPATFGNVDADDDGYFDAACCNHGADGAAHCGDDCDDTDDSRHPTVPEVCDGVDNDCNGATDEGLLQAGFKDTDADGFGDEAWPEMRCPGSIAFTTTGGDCDDLEQAISPLGVEDCDGIDNDCNGRIDEGLILEGFRDIDDDGYGDPALPETNCIGTPGLVDNALDCDDSDDSVSPDPAVSERCDGVDNDCNGNIDEGTIRDGFSDLDGDGFGDPNSPLQACGPGPGFSFSDGDCNDNDTRVYRDRAELCDGKDNDCDGSVDEDLIVVGFADLDGDLHGDPSAPIQVCIGAPRFSYLADDCDDSNNRVHGAQVEVCDAVDNDCDGFVDENAVAITWYYDGDDDGFGNVNGGVLVQCAPPDGYSMLPTDCNDNSSGVSPLAEEDCDGLDNDCNGFADYEVAPGNYEDDDRDGYLDAACALLGEDCDDDDSSIHPDAPNLCDGRDTDCDGVVDDGEGTVWYQDIDQDNFGDDGVPITSCQPPLGFVLEGGDCDDTNVLLSPGQVDLCDGNDQDCDQLIDEEALFFEAYVDLDGDGAGTGAPELMCMLADGYGLLPADCQDDDPLVYDGQDESCDNVDNDCDNVTDEDAARECDLPQATPVCIAGVCEVDSCMGDFGDCDTTPDNGCETNTMTDLAHCGSCNAACDIGPNATGFCLDGDCGMTCDNNFIDCDGYLDTGCEADFSVDPNNCGACGTRCSERANAAASCISAACTIACQRGYTSCDGDELTGCEVNTGNDTTNCGTCFNSCNAGEICADGDCLLPPYGGDGGEGDFMPTVDTLLPAGTHQFASIHIPAGVTVTTDGTGVLDLRVTGDVLIEGTIDLGGGRGANGGWNSGASFNSGGGGATGMPVDGLAPTNVCHPPAAGGLGGAGMIGAQIPGSTQCGQGGENGGGSGAGRGDSGGGGGGGFAGGGGGGGQGLASLGDGAQFPGLSTGGVAGGIFTGGTAGESGYAAYGGGDGRGCGDRLAGGGGGGSIGAHAAEDVTADSTFYTGSGGGGGGGAGSYAGGGGGGGGGGALRISTPTQIVIAAGGELLADGGAGGVGGYIYGGGGGGGSGGLIYLSAPKVDNRGSVDASGGTGGRRQNNACTNGGDGGPGRIRLSVLPEKCEVLGFYDPPLPGSCEITGNFTPGTAYVGLYPY